VNLPLSDARVGFKRVRRCPRSEVTGAVFGVSEGFRTPDLQDHNLAL
jgi:hypothetical protein